MANLTMIGLDEETGQQKSATFKTNDLFVKGKTMQSGTINFVANKKMTITFVQAFSYVPRITLTQGDTSISNPYTTSVSKTSFSVNFTSPFTGTVDWVALERE